jgi:hypothetical protein
MVWIVEGKVMSHWSDCDCIASFPSPPVLTKLLPLFASFSSLPSPSSNCQHLLAQTSRQTVTCIQTSCRISVIFQTSCQLSLWLATNVPTYTITYHMGTGEPLLPAASAAYLPPYRFFCSCHFLPPSNHTAWSCHMPPHLAPLHVYSGTVGMLHHRSCPCWAHGRDWWVVPPSHLQGGTLCVYYFNFKHCGHNKYPFRL